MAQRLQRTGKLTQALEVLKSIEPNHSDYLFANHDIGEIYLKMIKDPIKASQYFGIVTNHPTVKFYNDKRFTGSHVNEGIALFLTAEKIAPKSLETAQAHYAKAVEVLDRVSSQLRFVNQNQYQTAVNNVNYYKALSYHRMWELSKNRVMIYNAMKSWKKFLDTDHEGEKDRVFSNYVQDAKVYLKQAKLTIENLETKQKEK